MQYRLIPLALALVFACTAAYGQKKKKKKDTEEAPAFTEAPASDPAPAETSAADNELVAMYKDILNNSLEFNDLAVATQATYALMALEPDNGFRIDTLTAIYFQRGAYPQVVMVGSKILETRPDDLKITEMVAISKAQLGASMEALTDYESLFKQSNDIFHLYEIASLQYTVRRYGECETSIQRLLTSPEVADKEVTLNFKQGSQNVPMKAAVYNLYGVLQLDQGNKEAAIGHFKQAVQLFPEFFLAKNNLDALQQGK